MHSAIGLPIKSTKIQTMDAITFMLFALMAICSNVLGSGSVLAPDHLLEAGESRSSPISNLIYKVAFPVKEHQPLPLEQQQAVAQELKRRIGGGTLHKEVKDWAAIKLIIVKEGDGSDLDSFDQNVMAEIRRLDKTDLACTLVEIGRNSYGGVPVQSTVEFKFHFAPPAVRHLYPATEVTLVMRLLNDHVGNPCYESNHQGVQECLSMFWR